jgi:hypothetical protein
MAGGYSIAALVTEGVVVVTVRGRIEKAAGDELQALCSENLRQTGLRRMLVDFRAAVMVEDTLGRLERVRYADTHAELRACRVALLFTAKSNDALFVEQAALQRGHDLKVLTDGESAWRWLKTPLAD